MVRYNISDELASHSVPYSSIPESSPSDMPQTDHFKFSTPDLTLDEHITGQPGLPTQATAALGSTTGPLKTTIRLVSAPNSKPTLSPELGTPQLRPVDPPFDLVMASADESGIPVWPLSPQPAPFERRLYPVLPANELDEARQHQAKSRLPENAAYSQAPVNSTKELPNPWDKLPENAAHPQAPVSSTKELPNPWDKVQDLFSPAPKLPGKRKESTGIPRSEPFLFGSPLPRHSVSNKAFDTAAASVLEEMNKRLSAAGAQKVTTDVFGTIPVVTAATNRDSGSLHAQEMIDRFDKVHEEQFNKMDSIANHYAARRGVSGSKKRKSDVLGHGLAPARKRSSADTHVVGTASRGRMGIPGGFDDEEEVMDDVQEEGDRRMSKRVRVLEEDGGKDKGRRLTISPKKTDAEEKQAERERAATRKMLEMRKDKRRSSRHARMSIGPQATSSTSLPPLSPMAMGSLTGPTRADKGKATPRFGILSSAKSIVRSVWNFGTGSPKKASRTSTATAATKSKTLTAVAEPKETKPPLPPKKPSLPAASRPLESLATRKNIASARTGFSASSKALGDEAAKGGASYSRLSNSRISSGTTRMLNPVPAGSIGSRQSVNAMKDGVGISRSSASTRRAPCDEFAGTVAEGTNGGSSKIDNDNGGSGGNKVSKKASIFSPTRSTSRLFAPTASSLAKMRSPTGLPTVTRSKTSAIIAQRAKTPPHNAVLDAITNSSRRGGGNAGSPPGDKIFTTPLLLSPNQNRAVIPPPTKPTSLAAAATTLATAVRGGTRSPERPPATAGHSSSAFPSASTSRRTITAASTSKGQLPSPRKPRISRSRIIAKLGTQRAAAAGATSSSALTLSRPAAAAAASSKIPRASGGAVRGPRARSSMATATRRSYAGAKSTGRESDVLMSAKKHVRQSEFVRRRSRMTGSTVGVGVGGPRHAVDSDPDGSMAMDVDDA